MCSRCDNPHVATLIRLSICDAEAENFCASHVDAALESGYVDLALYDNLHSTTACC
jgi:hypothetical protein